MLLWSRPPLTKLLTPQNLIKLNLDDLCWKQEIRNQQAKVQLAVKIYPAILTTHKGISFWDNAVAIMSASGAWNPSKCIRGPDDRIVVTKFTSLALVNSTLWEGKAENQPRQTLFLHHKLMCKFHPYPSICLAKMIKRTQIKSKRVPGWMIVKFVKMRRRRMTRKRTCKYGKANWKLIDLRKRNQLCAKKSNIRN